MMITTMTVTTMMVITTEAIILIIIEATLIIEEPQVLLPEAAPQVPPLEANDISVNFALICDNRGVPWHWRQGSRIQRVGLPVTISMAQEKAVKFKL